MLFPRLEPLGRLSLVILAAVLLVSQGCMLSPYHNQEYPSRSSPIVFNGYVGAPNSQVEFYVQAWKDPQKCGGVTPATETYWQSLGTTYSSATPLYDNYGYAGYGFYFQTVIPTTNWCLMPKGFGGTGYQTHVTGIYRIDVYEPWYHLFTVEENWLTCVQQQPWSWLAIIDNCTRTGDNSDAVTIWANQ